MRRLLFSLALALTVGALSLGLSRPATAEALDSGKTIANLVAQEPNQDNLQMACPGSISVNNVDFTVFFTREAGFSRVEFRRRPGGQQIGEAFLSYDTKNASGQAIWRGSMNNAASVTLVHLSTSPGRPGDQVSVKYDGQWGRGTCR